MKKQQRVRLAFTSLLYEMSLPEQQLLLLISSQTKSRPVLRFEGKIEISEAAYFEFTKERMAWATLNMTVRLLLDRVIDIRDSSDWHRIPLVQEAGSCIETNTVFISFNQNVLSALSEIETTLSYNLEDAEKIRGGQANKFYSLIARHVTQDEVTYSLNELQEILFDSYSLGYINKFTVIANVEAINEASTNMLLKYRMEDNPNEESNPLFTFSAVKRYD